jgi:hypothetical protein
LQEEHEAGETQADADPGHPLRLEDSLLTDDGKIECGGKNGVAVEQGERRDQVIGLIDVAEVHGFCSGSSQPEHSEQDHPE